ncbi:hypothetical protein K0M31_015993 [Melipona bicolor]|uniref:Uncharacterized protein n=1 Tax=Melipona bicolor TaxID=60889 RepID=A0AA40G6K1_9HYME|nr:hypothetical protein K0M31_015993 [Melipona bicolor]
MWPVIHGSTPSSLSLVIYILNKDRKKWKNGRLECRALLDSESKTFLSLKDLAKKINLKRARIKFEFKNTVNMIKKEAHVQLWSRHTLFRVGTVCLVIDTIIAKMPNIPSHEMKIAIPSDIIIVDPQCDEYRQVVMLIESELVVAFYEQLCADPRRLLKRLQKMNMKYTEISSIYKADSTSIPDPIEIANMFTLAFAKESDDNVDSEFLTQLPAILH